MATHAEKLLGALAWFQASAKAGVTATMTDKGNGAIVNVTDIEYSISAIEATITLHERDITSAKTLVLSHWNSTAWQYGYVQHGSVSGSKAVVADLTSAQKHYVDPSVNTGLCGYRVYEVRINSNSALTDEQKSSLAAQNITLTVSTSGRGIVWTAATPTGASAAYGTSYSSTSQTVTISLPANWDGTYNMDGVTYDKDVLVAVEGAGYTDTTNVAEVTVTGVTA